MRSPLLALAFAAMTVLPAQARGLKDHEVDSVKGTATPASAEPVLRSRLVRNGPDAARNAAGTAADEGPCPMWSDACAEPRRAQAFIKVAVITPINPGFKALGAAGKTGTIDGPGAPGNGSYTVDANNPYEVKLTIKTGRIDAQLTLSRDPSTGKDTVRRNGRIWKQGAWTTSKDVSFPAQLVYDAARDNGTITWNEEGLAKKEGYWHGASGTTMTIELGGGWDHDFSQD